MDKQIRTATIKASILKLGLDEAALTEIMYLAKARIREAQTQKKEAGR
jgi:hypothetical protein